MFGECLADVDVELLVQNLEDEKFRRQGYGPALVPFRTQVTFSAKRQLKVSNQSFKTNKN